MRTKLGLALLAGIAVIFAGCTNVQKGTAAGGVGGAAIGAGWATTTGATAGTGALAGLGVGTVTGALASDWYYSNEDTQLTRPPQDKLSELRRELNQEKEQKQKLATELQDVQAQKSALMEAHEKAQQKIQKLKNSGTLSGDVKVSRKGGNITFTILSEVLFDSGEASLKSRGQNALAEAAEAIRNNFPDANLEVRGHTDSQPIRYSDWKSNWELSGARARRVLKYLVNKEGFDRKRLSFAGYGPTRPVASNDTAEGRRKNRRAEIVVVPEDRKVKRQTVSSE